MLIHIAKVNGVLWSGDAKELTAPALEGEVTVLRGHVPFVTTLRPGRLVVRDDIHAELFTHEVTKGILEVTGQSATILL